MMHRLICSVYTTEFPQLAHERVVQGSLWLSVYFQQILGQSLPYGLNLMIGKQKLYKQCEGNLLPSAYLINGTIERIPTIKMIGEERIFEGDLLVDCGIPLLIGERSRPVSKHLLNAQKSDWIGAIGEMHMALSEYGWEPKVVLRPVECFLIDLRPQSASFACITPWEFGRSLPHDPDVLRFPSVFVNCEVLHTPTIP
jgi:hypothetical protein